jgi:hypothetical protein
MKIKDLLTDRSRWVQGPVAMDRYGRSVYPESRWACKWCLWGAIEKCYSNWDDVLVVRDKLYSVLPYPNIIEWNERRGRTFDEVRAAVVAADV